ncbi:hypothetical protein YM304_15620 [Ilumatobacter coccineus YM16-304]|uniref:Tetratricopeptide repeat protein n=1 Tax=Ilumatobacter coccineus (strain NBRC 103263 / KCTC 29153 / YM16-304) TaxID=1313172 RepID=A0A6C7ECY4_ILUCY|nr:hypothetical protein YM304_15620 [Ilumatobacter coccineus YM16-304]
MIGAALAITLIVAASIGVARDRSGDDVETTADEGVVDVDIVASQQNPNPESLDELIAGLQTRLAGIPNDHTAWAALGLAYVQQAKATANPAFYPRADGALAESIALDADSNFLAYAGRSALASARHDFAAAKEHAEAGLAINAFSAPLHGALGDAELQLGNYDGAIEAVGRMSELRPDTASFARESYLWELRGNVDLATRFMESAREAAPTPADEAFAVFHLGELAFDQGDPTTALDLYNVAQSLVPGDPASLAGKAKAEAALGQVETALDHYARVVTIAPEPAYVTAYAELLDSLGRDDAAAEQYAVVAATEALFAENGVAPDAGPLLFLAEHGDPAAALAGAEAAIAERPFLAMYDAYAWALHKNGRHDEALVAIDEALALGTRNASYLYHSGMIKHALGDMPGAVADLTAALETNPHFDPLAAPIASETLAELVEQGVGS